MARIEEQKQSHWLAAIFMLLCLLIPVAAVLIYSQFKDEIASRESEIEIRLNRLALTTDKLAYILVEPTRQLEKDISLLASHQEWAPLKGRVDLRRDFLRAQRGRIELVLNWFGKVRPEHYLVSYLDNGRIYPMAGQEFARVHREDERLVTAGSLQLADKGERPYFRQAVEAGKLYFSRIDLNHENNERLAPFFDGKQTLRAAQPLCRSGKSDCGSDPVLGVIVINMDYGLALKHAAEMAYAEDAQLYVTNEAGQFLRHPEEEHDFAFDPSREGDKAKRIQDEFRNGDAANEALTELFEKTGEVARFRHPLREPQHAVYVRKIPLPNGRFLGLALSKSIVDIQTAIGTLETWRYLSVGALIIFGLPLTALQARRFFQASRRIDHQNQRIAENEARTTGILLTAPHGILILDQQGRVVDSNEKADRMFACEAQGRHVSELIRVPGEAPTANRIPDFLRDNERGSEAAGVTAKGEAFPAFVNDSRVNWGEGDYYTVVVQDITLQKAREAELETAWEEAESANQVMRDYFDHMAHDIRAPLQPLQLSAQMMMRKADPDGLSKEQIDKQCERILRATKYQESLLNGVMALVRAQTMESVDLDTKPSKVRTIASGALEQAALVEGEPTDPNQNVIRLELDDDLPMVLADREHAQRIMMNLVTNANKFTEQGLITIRASRQANAGHDWVVFSVEDTGKGMTDGQMSSLFTTYGSSEEDKQNRRKHRGVGLGLAVSKRMCTAMDGDMWATTTLGRGSVFSFRLPSADHSTSHGTGAAPRA